MGIHSLAVLLLLTCAIAQGTQDRNLDEFLPKGQREDVVPALIDLVGASLKGR